MAKKSWTEKYHTRTDIEIKTIDKAFADIPEGGKMLIATPAVLEGYVRQLPYAASVEMATLRKDLAIEHGAEYTCPVTSGIFLRIAAEKAWEEYQNGKDISGIMPFWRIISANSPLAKKLSCGVEFILQQRKAEGLAN